MNGSVVVVEDWGRADGRFGIGQPRDWCLDRKRLRVGRVTGRG